MWYAIREVGTNNFMLDNASKKGYTWNDFLPINISVRPRMFATAKAAIKARDLWLRGPMGWEPNPGQPPYGNYFILHKQWRISLGTRKLWNMVVYNAPSRKNMKLEVICIDYNIGDVVA